MSLATQLNGFLPEADPETNPLAPTWSYNNVVAWQVAGTAFSGYISSAISAFQLTVDNSTFQRGSGTGNDVMYVSGNFSGTGNRLQNLIATGTGLYGIDSGVQPSYTNVQGTFSGAYNQKACATGCKTVNPLTGAPAPLMYIARIEAGSALKGTGFGGGDYGANIVNRYGTDGSFYGDTGYNTQTSTSLWPWPNEARIQKDMCTNAGVTRGMCAKGSLTTYIWTYLGNPVPNFGGGTTPPNPCDLNADGTVNQTDVQGAIDQALGKSTCNSADLRQNGTCDVVDVQRVINASLGQSCVVGP
jgi:hypothetical protein